MYMGSRLVVVVNGVEAMKECFIKQGETFSARPWNYFKKLTKNKGKGVRLFCIWKFVCCLLRILAIHGAKGGVHICKRAYGDLT